MIVLDIDFVCTQPISVESNLTTFDYDSSTVSGFNKS